MNLNSTLTARDKKLLYMLVFIVIIFIFGWYLIRPLYKKTVADQESISIAASLQASNESKVIGLTTAQSLTDKFSQDYAESTSIYYDYMDSSEIDKLVTSYILKQGLMARDLTITMPTGYVSEKPYIYSGISEVTIAVTEPTSDELVNTEEIAETGTIAENDEIKSSTYYKEAVLSSITGMSSQQVTIIPTPMETYVIGQRNASGTESSELLCVQLSIVVEGDKEAEQAIIDDLTHNPSVRVTGFSWIKLDPVTFVLEDGSVLVVESDLTQLQISVNLYMKDKTE